MQGQRTCIELCSGCGGMSLGLKQAGFDHLLLVERDRHCIPTLSANGWRNASAPSRSIGVWHRDPLPLPRPSRSFERSTATCTEERVRRGDSAGAVARSPDPARGWQRTPCRRCCLPTTSELRRRNRLRQQPGIHFEWRQHSSPRSRSKDPRHPFPPRLLFSMGCRKCASHCVAERKARASSVRTL
jgi:hypothetical protein